MPARRLEPRSVVSASARRLAHNVAGYTVNRSPILSMRDGDWKLLMNPDRSRVELYRIPEDPMEMTNVAPANPGVVQRMSEKMLAWQKTLPEGPMDPTAGKNDWKWPSGR